MLYETPPLDEALPLDPVVEVMDDEVIVVIVGRDCDVVSIFI